MRPNFHEFYVPRHRIVPSNKQYRAESASTHPLCRERLISWSWYTNTFPFCIIGESSIFTEDRSAHELMYKRTYCNLNDPSFTALKIINNTWKSWGHGMSRRLFASVPIINSLARFTSHVTAPNKLALAPVYFTHYLSIVTSPTTQVIASVSSLRGLVTHSPGCPKNTQLGVGTAVVGRAVEVHQRVPWYSDPFVLFPSEAPLLFDDHRFDGIVILGF